jgi:serine phosphatase RsbU (regulator of sigma subunit)
MTDVQIKSKAFEDAKLASEQTRILALLIVFSCLFFVLLLRGSMSLAEGRSGEAWPFAILLGAVAAYEAVWLRLIRQAMNDKRSVQVAMWRLSIFVESLPPTAAIFLQVHTPSIGPARALTSPVVLVYFLFVILSTLRLNPGLSRMCGGFSAAGYAAVSIYTFAMFPEVAANQRLFIYGTFLSNSAVLLIGGMTAGEVSRQISRYVLAALREAESRAKVAQFEHDLGIARSIQQGLLPKSPPQIKGFDIAGWNQPTDETGGDYFDWQQLPDGRVAVTVADVTGHGIGSALGMAGCRAYTRAGFAGETDLRKLLGRLNQLLYEDLPPEKFVTLAAGLLNPQDATLELISAGHGPLLFYSSAEDRFFSYEAHGLPLGLLPHLGYSGPQVLKFTPGDILVLVTDGFIEWANGDNEDFGEARLRNVIRSHREMPATTIISELHSAIVNFAGQMPQFDDLTALIVKRV